jgi:Fe2+ transport system protein FeoA
LRMIFRIGSTRARRSGKQRQQADVIVAEREQSLADIPLRQTVELVRMDLPADEQEPLLELGILPGCLLCPVRRSLFGDPVLLVGGSLIALRRELAGCLCVKQPEAASN